MRVCLRLLALMVLITPSLVYAAEPDKPVRLVWYPRFSPDSKSLATAHGDWDAKNGGEVRLWDAATGKPKYVLRQARGIRSVSFSPKSTLLAAGGYGRYVAIYDTQTGKQIRQWTTPATAEVVQYHPDGKLVVVAHGDGAVRLWEVETGKQMAAISGIHKGEIWGMMVSPDGKLAATAGQDGMVCITQIESGKRPHRFPTPGSNSVAFTSNGKQLAAGAGDSAIRIYDVENGTELQKLDGHEGGSITDLQFGPKDKVLVSAGFDKTIRVWDLSDPAAGKLKETLRGHAHFVFGAALSADGKLIASGGWDDRVKVWNAQTFKEVWSWDRSKASE